MSMKIKRAVEMSELEKAVINMIWQDIKNIKDDGVWRKYEKKFIYLGDKYLVKCAFKVSNQYFTYKNFVISYDTQLIEIPQGANLH